VSAPPRGRRNPLVELGRLLEIQNLGLNLPFALAFLLVALHGLPTLPTFLLIVVAFVAARNAGHAFNRWADRDLDALNPRTQARALVTGKTSAPFALGPAGVNAAVLAVAAWWLNPLALLLVPVALAIVLGYSYTKRVSALTTVFLGLVEGLTPPAVYIAVLGTLPPAALAASAALLLWGTAFETIHSLGDLEADRASGTYSIPVRLGVRRSSELVPVLHAGALALLAVFGAWSRLSIAFYLALAAMAAVVASIDARFLQRPTEAVRPFRAHIALGFIFLVGVVLSLFFTL
jgi:4-hydroxybenzoate polyprenyltransferase